MTAQPMPSSATGPLRPFIAKSGPASERGRLRRHLLRAPGAGGKESNWVPTKRRRKIRSAVPLLRPGEGRCSTRRGSCRTSSVSLLSDRRRRCDETESSRNDLVIGRCRPCCAWSALYRRHDKPWPRSGSEADRLEHITKDRHAHRNARIHSRLRQGLSDRRDDREALRRA